VFLTFNYRSGFRVFAADLRGHGDSTRSKGGDYNPDIMAADLEGFILELDLYVRPVAVVGAGLGACVGTMLAARAPRLVGALVQLGFSPFPSDAAEPHSDFNFFFAQALMTEGAESK
jgi:pimeloyl-ACP methyl ester carboxylesterase